MIFGLETMTAGLLYLAAAGVQCSAQPPPPIRVSPSKASIQYDLSKSQKDLDKMQIDTVNPYGKHKETHVGGLMSGEIRVEHQIGFVQEIYETAQKACLHYDTLTVNILINPTIYIASDHKPGSCRYEAILAHEKKHVEVDRIVVNKYSKRIAEALTFAVRKYGASFGPFDAGQIGPTQKKLQTYIDGIVKGEVDKLNAERRVLQQQVDSLEEYERVRKLCP